MEFEWDDAKSHGCFLQRGFDIADAIARSSIRAVSSGRTADGILVRIATGCLARIEGRIRVVTYTARGPVIRVISARKANRTEVREI